jgi:hypothetical protein
VTGTRPHSTSEVIHSLRSAKYSGQLYLTPYTTIISFSMLHLFKSVDTNAFDVENPLTVLSEIGYLKGCWIREVHRFQCA